MGLLNFNYFTGESPSLNVKDESIAQEKKKNKKEINVDLHTAEVIEPIPMYQSNQPYIGTYNDTNMMLRTSIAQIDDVNNDVVSEIKTIKDSKTLKNKYGYITDLTSTASSLISTKIAAIREINKTITDCHNLEMKRAKEIMQVQGKEAVDDDKRIQDMYTAFISAPIGNGDQIQFAPPIQNVTNNNQFPMAAIGNQDAAFNNYMSNLSPVQNMMLHEDNQNVKTVVRYDPNTGSRQFDVVDLTTGQSIPNMPRPAEMFLEDTVIDLKNNIAKNTNLGTTYPLIVSQFTVSTY